MPGAVTIHSCGHARGRTCDHGPDRLPRVHARTYRHGPINPLHQPGRDRAHPRRPRRRRLRRDCGAAHLHARAGGHADAPVAPEPTPVPTPGITFAPSIPLSTPGPDGVDGAVIALDVFLDHRVTLAFSDPDHLIVDAVTGHAKDGMSVGRGETIVRNIDPKTVEVTWSGLSGDEAIRLVAKPQGTGVLLQFGEQVTPVNPDAMGADRVAVLTFANPVDAADIVTDFTTAGD